MENTTRNPKPFKVGTFRTFPFENKPLPPAVFPKNPLYNNVQSKVMDYIQSTLSSNKVK